MHVHGDKSSRAKLDKGLVLLGIVNDKGSVKQQQHL